MAGLSVSAETVATEAQNKVSGTSQALIVY